MPRLRRGLTRCSFSAGEPPGGKPATSCPHFFECRMQTNVKVFMYYDAQSQTQLSTAENPHHAGKVRVGVVLVLVDTAACGAHLRCWQHQLLHSGIVGGHLSPLLAYQIYMSIHSSSSQFVVSQGHLLLLSNSRRVEGNNWAPDSPLGTLAIPQCYSFRTAPTFGGQTTWN